MVLSNDHTFLIGLLGMMSNKDVDDLEEDIIEVNSERSIGRKECNQISAVNKVAVINRMSEGWLWIFFSPMGGILFLKKSFFREQETITKTY